MLTKNPALLSERQYDTNHKWFNETQMRIGWYAPRAFLNHFPSVVECELTNTTSSAGDWSGYIVQQLNGTFYLIPFWQENCAWSGGGYTFGTGKPVAWSKDNFTKEEIFEILGEDY